MTPRPATRAEVIERVRALAATRLGETLYVAVDGPGAAGKSTLAAAMDVTVPRVQVVAVDDFAGPGVEEWDWVRFERQLAAPLRAGRPARYQRWDYGEDAGREWYDIEPGRLVVVEGVSAYRAEVRVPWDLRVWVEAPRRVRLKRAIDRDGRELLDTWLERWMPSEDRYIARERPAERADLIVDGTAADPDGGPDDGSPDDGSPDARAAGG